MTEKEKQIMVTCEYCGGIVNILNHESCPGCGARFNAEQLEKNRRIIDKYNTEILNKKYDEPEYRENEPSAPQKKSKKWLLIIPVVILLAAALVFIFLPKDEVDDTEEYKPYNSYGGARSELTDTLPYGYEKIDCNISGDKELFDDGIIEIEITGLYENTADRSKKIIEYVISNYSNENIHASFACKSINGKTDDNITNIIMAGEVSAIGFSKETLYSKPFELEDEEINEIVFNNVVVSSTEIWNGTYKSKIDNNGKEFSVKFN